MVALDFPPFALGAGWRNSSSRTSLDFSETDFLSASAPDRATPIARQGTFLCSQLVIYRFGKSDHPGPLDLADGLVTASTAGWMLKSQWTLLERAISLGPRIRPFLRFIFVFSDTTFGGFHAGIWSGVGVLADFPSQELHVPWS